MHRIAHGEFVSRRGELASYAVGWASEADPHAGWITIGIGAGNEGGGTFHARVFTEDGSYGFSLTDDRLRRGVVPRRVGPREWSGGAVNRLLGRFRR